MPISHGCIAGGLQQLRWYAISLIRRRWSLLALPKQAADGQNQGLPGILYFQYTEKNLYYPKMPRGDNGQ
jgi:hypothetical protein